jgi:hypothetical protein
LRQHRILTRLASIATVLTASAALVVLGAAPAGADNGFPSVTTIANTTGPLGVAAMGTYLYESGPYFNPDPTQFPVQQYVNVVDAATVSVGPGYQIPSMLASAFCQSNSCPADYYVEPYMAVSQGLGGFPAGDVFITQGANIYEMPAGGGPITLFTTVPGLFSNVPLSGGYPEYASGITFDNVGTFGYDMIVTSTNGSVWAVPFAGPATEIGNMGTVIEGPSVAPASFSAYAGDVLVAAEDQNAVLALSPAGVKSTVAIAPSSTVNWAEGTQVVPSPLCGMPGPGGTNYSWFGSMYGNSTVGGLPTSSFTGLSGDVVVQGEDSGMITLLSSSSSTSVTSTQIETNLPQQEGATMDQCTPDPPPPPTGTARTVGFWRNKNGNAVLDPDSDGVLEHPQLVQLGNSLFGANVTTIQTSNSILAGGICAEVSCTPLSADLHEKTFGVLAAQTLALSYNMADTSFQGLVFSSCSPYLTGPLTSLGLSTSSSLEQVLKVANSLIAGAGAGGTTTQAEAGAMNGLLGQCVNLER